MKWVGGSPVTRNIARTARFLTLPALLLSVSCTHVSLSDAAEGVDVLTLEQAEACDRIGRTASSTKATIMYFPRGDGTLEEELSSLARNAASKMGGTAVAPLGEVADGEQDFGIYRCDEASGEKDAD
jgi:hypothetical protein